MDLQLNERVALVTGAHRGTGQIIAQRLAAEGATVWLHGFDQAAAEAAASDMPGRVHPVAADITTDAGAAALIEQLQGAGAAVEILVNNYGTAARGDWASAGSDDWLGTYQHNVLSAQRLIRALLPAMRTAGWGRIINLGTVGSSRPNASMPHYYAAKGALANLTIGLAREVGASGVRVNLVSPGLIRTPEVEAAWIERGRRKGWGDTWEAVEPYAARDIPIGRISRREEIADVVCFLASPRADAIHGQNIRIDGGALGTVT